MKQVRIDHKTVIEVDGRISDDQARKEYLEKIGRKDVKSHKLWEGRSSIKQTDIPRHDIVFPGDNTMRRLQHSK